MSEESASAWIEKKRALWFGTKKNVSKTYRKEVLSKTELMYKSLLAERTEIERSLGNRRGFDNGYHPWCDSNSDDQSKEDEQERSSKKYSCYQEEYEEKYGFYAVEDDYISKPVFKTTKKKSFNNKDKYLVILFQ